MHLQTAAVATYREVPADIAAAVPPDWLVLDPDRGTSIHVRPAYAPRRTSGDAPSAQEKSSE